MYSVGMRDRHPPPTNPPNTHPVMTTYIQHTGKGVGKKALEALKNKTIGYDPKTGKEIKVTPFKVVKGVTIPMTWEEVEAKMAVK